MTRSRQSSADAKSISAKSIVFAALSGILLALAFPRPNFSIFAWFALVPLLLACGKKKPKEAFKIGFIGGVVAYSAILYWINIVVTTYGRLPWVVSIPIFLLLVGYLSLYMGAATYLTRRLEDAGIEPLLSFPLIWTALEFLRSFLLTGFPWASLGHSQFRVLPLVQMADITGVYGLSFLIALSNVVLYRMLKAVVAKEPLQYPTRSAFLFLGLLLLALVYGIIRLNGGSSERQLKVALIQGNIDQDIKWDPAYQEMTVAAYERLTREAAASGADLVVWPESATPFFFQEDNPLSARVKGLAKEIRSFLVFGSPAYETVNQRVRYLNSAFLVSPTGEVLGRSDKIHLVPFGEYVPLATFLPFVSKMVQGIGDFSPGERPVPLNTGKGQMGVLVCFEGIFPGLAREYVREGSRLLVNITNDAWFGRSSAPYQHLSMIVFRAVENRVPVIRAANTGITSIIDSRGHIRGMTPIFKEAVLTGEVQLGGSGTIYGRIGDLFAWSCVVAVAYLAFMARRGKDPKQILQTLKKMRNSRR